MTNYQNLQTKVTKVVQERQNLQENSTNPKWDYIIVGTELPLVLAQVRMVEEVCTNVKYKEIEYALRAVKTISTFINEVNNLPYQASVIGNFQLTEYSLFKSLKNFALAPGRIIIAASPYAEDLRVRGARVEIPTPQDVKDAQAFLTNQIKNISQVDPLQLTDRAEQQFKDLNGFVAKGDKLYLYGNTDQLDFKAWTLNIPGFGLKKLYDMDDCLTFVESNPFSILVSSNTSSN